MTGNPRPPHYLSKHSRHTNVTLGQEVKETLVAVKKLLDHQRMLQPVYDGLFNNVTIFSITSWMGRNLH